jgi:hypothetical protein
MENWKPALGFEGYYEVSDLGRVKRVARGPRTRPGLINRPGDRRGYAGYTLCVGNVRKTLSGHRLVWESHVGPIPDRMVVNHKNGIKTDNRLANLEITTHSQNVAHTYRVLNRSKPINPNYGERNGRAKLTAEEVASIREEYAKGGISQQAIADRYGVNQTTISIVVRGVGWAV